MYLDGMNGLVLAAPFRPPVRSQPTHTHIHSPSCIVHPRRPPWPFCRVSSLLPGCLSRACVLMAAVGWLTIIGRRAGPTRTGHGDLQLGRQRISAECHLGALNNDEANKLTHCCSETGLVGRAFASPHPLFYCVFFPFAFVLLVDSGGNAANVYYYRIRAVRRSTPG
jgi:hypothetical protein